MQPCSTWYVYVPFIAGKQKGEFTDQSTRDHSSKRQDANQNTKPTAKPRYHRPYQVRINLLPAENQYSISNRIPKDAFSPVVITIGPATGCYWKLPAMGDGSPTFRKVLVKLRPQQQESKRSKKHQATPMKHPAITIDRDGGLRELCGGAGGLVTNNEPSTSKPERTSSPFFLFFSFQSSRISLGSLDPAKGAHALFSYPQYRWDMLTDRSQTVS